MKRTMNGKTRAVLLVLMVSLLLGLGACKHSDLDSGNADPSNPWAVTAVEDEWLGMNPYPDKHDGGWVYSAREDCFYAMYGDDASGQNLYRIDHIGHTSELAAEFLYGRHGSQPVIDDTGTFIYMPPSETWGGTDQLERYNTTTSELETLAQAPDYATYSHGAWKNGKLWIVLDDNNLYSYDPETDEWSSPLYDFGAMANVAGSGPGSNLIYVMVDAGVFFSYDVATDTVTPLDPHPYGFELGGNCQLTWFGASVGFIYAADGQNGVEPAIYDIATGTWQQLADPQVPTGWSGHATYDSTRMRLYVTGAEIKDGEDNYDSVWYYQY